MRAWRLLGLLGLAELGIAVALWWLLRAGVARVGLVGVGLANGRLFPAELGGLLEGLERLRPGKRQP